LHSISETYSFIEKNLPKMLRIKTLLLALLAIPFIVLSQESEKIPEGYKPDTRIDNMGYWRKMAKEGLVDVQANVPPQKAKYTGSAINSRSVKSDDSVDVPVTEESSTQSENSIFVNPNDIDNILNSNNSTTNPASTLYGANGLYSMDAGTTWEGQITGTGGNNSGDPAVTIGTNGNYYNGFIDNSSGQSVAVSEDNGQTWTSHQVAPKPSGFGSLLDKNHLWIDNSLTSTYNGNLYSAWTSFGGTNNDDIEISRSEDDGVTWSTPINVSSAVNAGSHCQGVNVHTGPAGEVYAAFSIYDGGPEGAIGLAVSEDGGVTYAPATRIIDDIKGIRQAGVSKDMRVNSFPSMAVDISDGPYSGNIYVVWANIGVPGTNVGPEIDVYMIKSTNGGDDWSEPIRVNQDPMGEGKEHYFPWLTCDPETGTLAVVFYDDRNVSSAQAEVFCAVSYDTGESWDDFKVSDVSFIPSPIPGLASSYFGDYLSITSRGGMVYPCWTDNRSGVAMTYVSPFETLAAPMEAIDPLPANSSQNIDPFASLHWVDVRERSDFFKVFVGTDNPPTNIVNGDNVNDTLYAFTEDLDYGTQYFWRIDSYNNFGSVQGTTWNFTTGSQPDEDFETGNFSQNDWYFEGNANWEITNAIARNGIYSAQSGTIEDGQQTSLMIELDVFSSPFPQPISFWKKVSSQSGADKLEFLIDNELKGEWSGEEDWSFESYNVPGGLHIFEWRYTKDVASSQGDDAVWVDFIRFPALNVLSVNAGTDASICETDTYQLDGNANNYTSLLWTTSGDGIFDDSSILDPIYTPGDQDIAAGSVSLTLTVSDSEENLSDDITLTINPELIIELPAEDEICAGEDYQVLDITVENYSTILWISDGDGLFDDPTSKAPLYTPGNNDILNGMTTLTIEATGIYPCSDNSDGITLYIYDVPEQPGTPSGEDFVCVVTTISSDYETTGSLDALSYTWSILPEEAGTIEGVGTIGNVTWNSDYFGNVEIAVSATNECGEGEYSESFDVVADPCVGTEELSSEELFEIYPNPNSGIFKVDFNNNSSEEITIQIANVAGEIIYKDQGVFNKTLDINLSDQPEGVYFLYINFEDSISVEKIIIR